MKYFLTTLFIVGGFYCLDKRIFLKRSMDHTYVNYSFGVVGAFLGAVIVYGSKWN